MGVVCCVPGCSNNRKEIEMHRFPKDRALFTTWINNIKCVNWMKEPQEVICKNKRVCSIHFGSEAISAVKRRSSTLKKDAVPTLFLPKQYVEQIYRGQFRIVQAHNEAIEDTMDRESDVSLQVDAAENMFGSTSSIPAAEEVAAQESEEGGEVFTINPTTLKSEGCFLVNAEKKNRCESTSLMPAGTVNLLVSPERTIEIQSNILKEETAKKKFKNLSDCYAKQLRFGTDHNSQKPKFILKYKKLPWIKQMPYLKPFVQTQPNITVIEDTHNENNVKVEPATSSTDKVDLTTEEIEERQNRVCYQKRESTKTCSHNKPVEKVISHLKNSEREQQNYDDLDLIFLGYAKSLKKLSPRLQTEAKFKIAQIIMETELQHHTEHDMKNSPKTTL